MKTYDSKIVVFHCRNLNLFPGGAQREFSKEWPGVSLVTIPCSGKIEAHFLLKTLAAGANGVIVLACAEQACKYMEGSTRSGKRVDYARFWLDKIGITPDRVEFVRLWPVSRQAMEAVLKDFITKLESYGAIGTLERV